MNDIRAKLEEIWPVPEGVYWRVSKGRYGCDSVNYVYAMDAHSIRLDTFTRCQETTDVYVSLVEELVNEVEECYRVITEYRGGCFVDECVDRAKQIIGREK